MDSIVERELQLVGNAGRNLPPIDVHWRNGPACVVHPCVPTYRDSAAVTRDFAIAVTREG